MLKTANLSTKLRGIAKAFPPKRGVSLEKRYHDLAYFEKKPHYSSYKRSARITAHEQGRKAAKLIAQKRAGQKIDNQELYSAIKTDVSLDTLIETKFMLSWAEEMEVQKL